MRVALSDPSDRQRIPEPPTGWGRVVWLGPGFLWMVSAAGSGELLFTPRVGALYGYGLLWAMLAAVALKWSINREIGRFAVCTGRGLLEGFATLPGPGGWALWLVLVPQLLVAVASIAGLAGSAATALALVLPGPVQLWMVGSVLAATALVLLGRYRGVERAATAIALALGVASVVAAISVRPRASELAGGLVPRVPGGVDYGEILPWIGFMLSGAAGMIWYSYWLRSRGYGAAADGSPVEPRELPPEARRRLRGWIGQMTLDTSVAVVGTLVVTLAFLVLGAEVLRPRQLVPEENRVAEVLGRLLGTLWGPVGFWFMVTAVFLGFWDTVLSDQDGFGRMFASGARALLARFGREADEARLQRAFVLVLVTAIPIGIYLLFGEPVGLLKIAGAIEAAHIPVVAALTLYLNRRELPDGLRPSRASFALATLGALFFAGFACAYLLQMFGGAR